MRIYLFPPSGRVIGIIALRNHLGLDCDLKPVDLGRGDQRNPGYVALNPNKKIPTLEDDGFVLWESNAILVYLASKRPESGVWPSDPRGQADVLRWLFWQSAHWDAEACGMVAYEKGSKDVLGLGPPDPAFLSRGEQNFIRFATVLNDSLLGKTWMVGNRLTIADFSIGGLLPTALRLELPVGRFPEICRWYEGLAALPAWREALVAREAALASLAPARRITR